MRSDTKALLKIFAWSGVVTLVLFAVLATAAVGWVKPQTAAFIGLGCFLVGAVLIGRKLGPALTGRRVDRADRPPETDR
jgi:hypothetical protein